MKIFSFILLLIFCFSELSLFSQSDKLHIAISNYAVIKNDLVIHFVLDSQDSVKLKFYGGDKGFTFNCDDYLFTNHYIVIDKFDETDKKYKRIACNSDIDFMYDARNDSVVVVSHQLMQRQIKLTLDHFTYGTYQLAVGQIFFYNGIKCKAVSGYIYFKVLKAKSKTKPKVIFYPTPSLAQL